MSSNETVNVREFEIEKEAPIVLRLSFIKETDDMNMAQVMQEINFISIAVQLCSYTVPGYTQIMKRRRDLDKRLKWLRENDVVEQH